MSCMMGCVVFSGMCWARRALACFAATMAQRALLHANALLLAERIRFGAFVRYWPCPTVLKNRLRIVR